MNRDPLDRALDNGVWCPTCKEGTIHKVIHAYPVVSGIDQGVMMVERTVLQCNQCHKNFQITYKTDPFKILKIEEAEE